MEKMMGHFTLPNGKKRGRPARTPEARAAPPIALLPRSPPTLRVLCVVAVEEQLPELVHRNSLAQVPTDLLVLLLRNGASRLSGVEVAQLLVPRLEEALRRKSLHSLLHEAPASRLLPLPEPSKRLLSVLHPHSEPHQLSHLYTLPDYDFESKQQTVPLPPPAPPPPPMPPPARGAPSEQRTKRTRQSSQRLDM